MSYALSRSCSASVASSSRMCLAISRFNGVGSERAASINWGDAPSGIAVPSNAASGNSFRGAANASASSRSASASGLSCAAGLGIEARQAERLGELDARRSERSDGARPARNVSAAQARERERESGRVKVRAERVGETFRDRLYARL